MKLTKRIVKMRGHMNTDSETGIEAIVSSCHSGTVVGGERCINLGQLPLASEAITQVRTCMITIGSAALSENPSMQNVAGMFCMIKLWQRGDYMVVAARS